MLFSRGKVTVDCYTTNPQVYEGSKIAPGVNHYPDWWKNIPVPKDAWKDRFLQTRNPLDLGGPNTMKTCVGFINLFKCSFVLPLWSEVRIHIGSQEQVQTQNLPPYSYMFVDGRSGMSDHSPSDHNNAFALTEYQHLKLHSPWHIICDSPIQWITCPPTWHMMNEFEPITILPGMTDFFYQSSSHINMFVRRAAKEDLFLDLPFGLPLYHLIPQTDKKVVFNHHLVSVDELEHIVARRGAKVPRYFGAAFMKHKRWRNKS